MKVSDPTAENVAAVRGRLGFTQTQFAARLRHAMAVLNKRRRLPAFAVPNMQTAKTTLGENEQGRLIS